MARQRMLKPELWDDADLVQLSRDGRLLFIGLMSMADDYGHVDARASFLKKQIFGYDDDLSIDAVDELLAALVETCHNVEMYEVDGQRYIWLKKWEGHQDLRYRSQGLYPCHACGRHHRAADYKEADCASAPIALTYILRSTEQVLTQFCAPNYVTLNNVTLNYPADSQTDPDPGKMQEERPQPRPVAGQIPASPDKPTMLFTPDTPQFHLASLLRDKILEHNPKAKVPKLDSGAFQGWCYHVDLLLRIDGRESEEVERTINWCQADNFWHRNILSTRNLREKYDRLYLGANATPKSPNGRNWAPSKPVCSTGPPTMTLEEAVAAGVKF